METVGTEVRRSATIGLSQRERARYSFARAILGSAHGKLAAEASFEVECSRATAKALGVPEPLGQAFYLPSDIAQTLLHDAQRDLTASNDGTNLISTVVAGGLAENWIRYSALARLGAQTADGLKSNITLPVETTPPTPTWLATDGVSQIVPAQPTISARSGEPHTVAALTTLSHTMLRQTAGLAERFATNSLSVALSNAVDTDALAGPGANGRMHGLVGLSNVGSISGSSIALSGILDFQVNSGAANAVANPASFGFVAPLAIAKTLAARQKFTSSSTALWEGSLFDGVMAGHRAIGTPAAPASTLIGGDFSQAIICSWPGLLLQADPYTGFRTGVVTLRAMLSVDVLFIRPQSFSVATGVS